MIIENSYLTHSNGKILSILGFGLMSLYMLVCFGIGFTGWYNGFFQFIRDVASWGFLAGMFSMGFFREECSLGAKPSVQTWYTNLDGA